MNENTNFVSRRSALRGIAGFAGASAVGVGALSHASEPAAAQVTNEIGIDDITIELKAGEDEAIGLSELGFSDLWFDAYWENITTSVYASFSAQKLYGDYTPTVGLVDLVDLGVDGDGAESFGYGETYADSYTVDLDGGAYLNGATPVHTDPDDTDFLSMYQLESGETEKTVRTRLSIELWLADEGSQDISMLLDTSEGLFDTTLQRIEPTGGVSHGEGVVYGEN